MSERKRGRNEADVDEVRVALQTLEHGTLDQVRAIISTGVLIHTHWNAAVFAALRSNQQPMEKLDLLHDLGVRVKSSVDVLEFTLLDRACMDHTKWDLVLPLLERGWGDANRTVISKEKGVISPVFLVLLHAECSMLTEKHKQVVHLLVAFGANWNTVSSEGKQLFVYAVVRFKPEIIAFILESYQIDIDTLSVFGPGVKLTPLMGMAALCYDYVKAPKVASLLIASGASPVAVDGSTPHWSALQVATYHSNAVLVALFIPVMRSYLTKRELKTHLRALPVRAQGKNADHLQTWLLTHDYGNKLTETWIHNDLHNKEESLECFWSRLRLLGPLASFSAGTNPAKWRWLARESQGRYLNNKGTLLHKASASDNVVALRTLTAMGTLNPFLRDSQRKTARQVAVSNEARHILLAYEQWKPVRVCQVWWGPVFLERAFAWLRAMRYLPAKAAVSPDMRRYLMAFLAAGHAV